MSAVITTFILFLQIFFSQGAVDKRFATNGLYKGLIMPGGSRAQGSALTESNLLFLNLEDPTARGPQPLLLAKFSPTGGLSDLFSHAPTSDSICHGSTVVYQRLHRLIIHVGYCTRLPNSISNIVRVYSTNGTFLFGETISSPLGGTQLSDMTFEKAVVGERSAHLYIGVKYRSSEHIDLSFRRGVLQYTVDRTSLTRNQNFFAEVLSVSAGARPASPDIALANMAVAKDASAVYLAGSEVSNGTATSCWMTKVSVAGLINFETRFGNSSYVCDIRHVAVSPSGDLYVSGMYITQPSMTTHWAIARIDAATGTLDSTFGSGGWFIDLPKNSAFPSTQGMAAAVSILADNSIIAIGTIKSSPRAPESVSVQRYLQLSDGVIADPLFDAVFVHPGNRSENSAMTSLDVAISGSPLIAGEADQPVETCVWKLLPEPLQFKGNVTIVNTFTFPLNGTTSISDDVVVNVGDVCELGGTLNVSSPGPFAACSGGAVGAFDSINVVQGTQGAPSGCLDASAYIQDNAGLLSVVLVGENCQEPFLHPGALAGIIVGGIVVASLFFIPVCWHLHRRRVNREAALGALEKK